MIKQMEKEHTHTQMELNMQDNGKMINKMVLEFKNGQMDNAIKDNIPMVLKQGKEY